MLTAHNLENWMLLVLIDAYKPHEWAPVLCCSEESHIDHKTAKGRKQKTGIHIAFKEDESFTHLGGKSFFLLERYTASLTDGTDPWLHPFLQRQTTTYLVMFSYA